MEQLRRHGSSVRYIHYPMTPGYQHGGVVGHVARCQGSRLGAQDRFSWFLVIPFGRTVITLYTPPVPHGPGANSVQVSPMIGACACAGPTVNNAGPALRQEGISLVAIIVVLAVRARSPFSVLLQQQ